MPTSTDTTNTSVTKVKLPLDRVFCQFECYQQTEKTDANGKTSQVFDYKPVDSYKLYLFYKKNDQFFRMPGNTPPAEPIVTADDHAEYIISDKDVTEKKCNYAFKKGATYYGYFAGKELTEAEITGLMGERSYVLLKIVPSDSGVLRLDFSLFQYIVLLQQLEDGLTGDVALTKINTVYKSNFSSLTSDIEKQLYKNDFMIATNNEPIQMSRFFEALSAQKKGEVPVWEKSLADVVTNAITFHEDPNATATNKLLSFENALQKITDQQYPKGILESHVLGATLGKVVPPPGTPYSFTYSIEEFFYQSNFSELTKNYIENFYIEVSNV
ncbi:MAG: hypothetical protein ABUK01_07905 [Leptospirales bacterium]